MKTNRDTTAAERLIILRIVQVAAMAELARHNGQEFYDHAAQALEDVKKRHGVGEDGCPELGKHNSLDDVSTLVTSGVLNVTQIQEGDKIGDVIAQTIKVCEGLCDGRGIPVGSNAHVVEHLLWVAAAVAAEAGVDELSDAIQAVSKTVGNYSQLSSEPAVFTHLRTQAVDHMDLSQALKDMESELDGLLRDYGTDISTRRFKQKEQASGTEAAERDKSGED